MPRLEPGRVIINSRIAMTAKALLPAGVHGVEHARIATTGREAIDLAVDIVTTGTGSISGELFGIGKGSLLNALKSRLTARDGVRLLADPETMASSTFRKLQKLGAELEPWGGNGLRKGDYVRGLNARKVHAKLLHGPSTSWLSTVSMLPSNSRSFDVAMELTGASRDAARELTRVALAGDEVGVVQAAIAAANKGVLLNDAALGVSHLTRSSEQLISGATRELLVATKIVDDVHFASMLSAAEQRGVAVTLVTHVDSRPTADVLRALGNVRPRFDATGALHGNVVVADGAVGMFGSAHMSARALGRSTAARLSHEMGAITDDPVAVARLRDFVQSVTGVVKGA